MSIQPWTKPGLRIAGTFCFSAKPVDGPKITDSYELTIQIPEKFPKVVPQVTEDGYKIPRKLDNHVNSDGTLCLGSPLRLLHKLSQRPSLVGFAADCIVPYLYAMSYRQQYGGPLLFDELAHGAEGELVDYMDLFHLSTTEAALRTYRLIQMKKQRANKHPCPCGCGKRLGRCKFNRTIRRFRRMVKGL